MSNEMVKDVNISSVSEMLKRTEDNKIVENQTIFNEYTDKKEIGINIFKELNKRFHKNGFVLQDNSKDIGILSQCQSMQTLVSLAQDFGLDFNTRDYFTGQKGTIREIMDIVIEDVIERLKNDDGSVDGYTFDATPYDRDHFSKEYSNIDTITWVVTSFLLVLKYHAHIGEVCKWEATLVDVVKEGLKYINEAFIKGKEDSSRLDVGWNFTKDCKEPSLYFSFTVCECYLDVFATFEVFLNYLHAKKNSKEEEYGIPVNPELEEEFINKAKEYEENKDRKVDKPKARYDEYNELVRIFRLVNDIHEDDELRIEGTIYEEFEQNCKTVARKVWYHVHEDLAEKFYYNDLQNTVTENELRMSTTSDVLFNTVYIVNIMVGAGLDEILDLERQQALLKNDLDLAHKTEREYNNLLESCLLAVQKAFRTYERLKNSGKEYIVDQFLVGFNEDFDGHPIAVNELRKLRMRCFSLLPLLIHTNNVVSEFLVRYPQYNMKKYLEYILDNRLLTKDGKATWIWESDGFFSGSNYYYVLALNEFYVYHEEYEKRYIEIGEKNIGREKEIKDRYLQELQAPTEIIGKQKSELDKQKFELDKNKAIINQKEETIKVLEEKLKNIERPVEDAVRQVVLEEMKNSLPKMMADVFNHAAKVFKFSAVDATEDTDDGSYAELKDSLMAMFVEAMLNKYASTTKIKEPERYVKIKDRLKKDFSQVILRYINSVEFNDSDKSDLLKIFG